MARNTAFSNDKTRSALHMAEGSDQGMRYLVPNLEMFSSVCARHQLAAGIEYSNTSSLYCRFELLTYFTTDRFRLSGVAYHLLNRKLNAHHLISLPVATTLCLYPGRQVCRFVTENAIPGKWRLTCRLKSIRVCSGGSDIMGIVNGIAPPLEKSWHNEVPIKAIPARGGKSTFKRLYFRWIVAS